MRDWLAADHLAWFVIDAVAEMDLPAFYGDYRADGHGRAALDPAMMVALLLYAYAGGERSSRGIERRCHDDVAFRVIAANQAPDHATIARFRAATRTRWAELFGEVLGLCGRAGWCELGVVALDGDDDGGEGRAGDRSYEQIAAEILDGAEAVDAAEDELFGEARGDELPRSWSIREGPRAWLREAKRRVEAHRAGEGPACRARGRARSGSRARRLEAELFSEHRANAAYEAYRARG